jgi:hypothetical protein
LKICSIWKILLLRKCFCLQKKSVVFSFLHAERSENGEKKLMIFGLEKRWKNGQIIDDDICSPATSYFFYGNK